MTNKKGFAFIETIIMILVLATSLLLIYSSYKSIFISNNMRLYYDDITYVYKAYFTTNKLLDKKNLKNINFDNNVLIKLYDFEDTDLNKYKEIYNIESLYIIKNNIKTLKECINNSESNCEIYNNSLGVLDKNTKDYLKTLGKVQENTNYILIYNFKDNSSCEDEVCNHYFVWLDSGVSYE